MRPTVVVAFCAGLLFAACGKEIGDACQTSVDCSFTGNRFCDISQPGGYCTVDGCDESSCPSEAICVRFFPTAFSTRACDPTTEDRGTPGGKGGTAGAGGMAGAGGSAGGRDDAGADLDGGTDPDAGAPQNATDDASVDAPAGAGDATTTATQSALLGPTPGTDDCLPDEVCLPSGVCAPRATERRYCEYSCSDNSDCRSGYECRLVGTHGSVALSPSQQGKSKFCAPHGR